MPAASAPRAAARPGPERAGAPRAPAAPGGAPEIRRLGRVRYAEALALQERLRDELLAGAGRETVLLLEHPEVITFGRGSRPGTALRSDDELRAEGYDVFRVGRGGDVTYHGPGQLVGYPILDLARRGRDVHRYLRALEQVLIGAVADFGLEGVARPGYTGVWLDRRRKLASIGVGMRRWVTVHGFALNVATDLGRFAPIVPCGLERVEMTSMSAALGREVELDAVAGRVAAHLRRAFG